MDVVLELADKLSKAIARSKRYLDLRRAEAAVIGDEEAVAKLKERDELMMNLARKERETLPIEPEEKRRIAALDEFVKTDPKLAELSRAQADFQEMFNLVNEKITSALSGEEPQDEEEASDSGIILP